MRLGAKGWFVGGRLSVYFSLVGAILAGGYWFSILSLARLARDGVLVEGLVDRVVLERRGRSTRLVVYYDYAVGRRAFSGRGHAFHPNPPAEELHPGSIVTICHYPTDPGFSVLGHASYPLRARRQAVMLFALLAPALLLFGGSSKRIRPVAKNVEWIKLSPMKPL